jgi:Putative regulator of cell autolysis
MNTKLLVVLVLLVFVQSNWAQTDEKESKNKQIQPANSVNSLQRSASKLSKYLDENENEEKIASEYETLAKELINQGEYSKAEEYVKKAIQIYGKQNNKKKLYTQNRELARVQELQKNYANAMNSYQEASLHTKDREQKLICENDINRLKNDLNPEVKSVYIQQNIDLLEKKGLTDEKANAYQQMAETNIQLNQMDVAIDNYQKALSNVNQDQNIDVAKIQNKIAEVYVADKQYEKAIVLKQTQIQDASVKEDVKGQIEQLQTLSSVYFIDDKKEQGIASLRQAYDLALEKGRTIEAKNCLELLTEQYLKEKNYKESVRWYQTFLHDLEPLIQSDSTLIDAKVFQITEEKINQLEKERILKDQLLKEQNTFNTVLIVSILIMILLLVLIARSLYSNKMKSKRIALQSLRREMNPHFIFNSLNSVNQFIAHNNELEANKFLSSYSKLMRNAMENSNKDFIKLNKEIEQLKEYLALEHLRFQDKFSYEIHIDENLDTESISVPNMIIQPHLENAIWHGLRYKEKKGRLKLSFSLRDTRLLVTVEDNGIGLTKSKEIKTKNQKVHQSRGLTNITERIELLNQLYKTNIHFNIQEKEGEESGVIVEIVIG